ncbi:MAG: LysM peptidoglycan-binding domain-containing protein, partial [Candidatus Saccharimonadales bacterium]
MLLGGKRKSRRKLIRAILLLGEVVLLVAIIAYVSDSTKSQAQNSKLSVPLTSAVVNSTSSINPLDQLSSAMIALTVARLTNLPETTAVSNQADSEIALLSVATANNSVIQKPQVVATNYASNREIKEYVVQSGDSVTSIAQKFNLSSNSIIWSNNIIGDYVAVGAKLLIPPINGIVYTVKAGDTPTALAQKYNSSTSLLTAYNDAEISGIYAGERIIIPNGTEPAAVSFANVIYGWGSTPIYGYNGYDYGYCTYWVAKLRASAGHPLPDDLGDASTWAIRAQEFGLAVGTTP